MLQSGIQQEGWTIYSENNLTEPANHWVYLVTIDIVYPQTSWAIPVTPFNLNIEKMLPTTCNTTHFPLNWIKILYNSGGKAAPHVNSFGFIPNNCVMWQIIHFIGCF